MAMTVTVTAGGSVSNGIAADVEVLTGAAAAQPGNTVGSTQPTQNLFGVAITPTFTGSLVYGAFLGNFAANWTPFSGATAAFIQDTSNGASGLEYIALKSAATTTAATPVTLGCSSATVNGLSLSLCEIKAAGTLAEDGSAPAASGFVNATTWTSASFTPPTGVVLVVMVSSNGGASATTMTVSDSSGLTWTEQVKQNTAGDGYCGVWTAVIPASPAGQGGPPSLLHPGAGPGMVRAFRSIAASDTPAAPPYVPDVSQAPRSSSWMPGRGPGGLFAKTPGDTSITRVQAPPGSAYRSLGFYFLDASGAGEPTALIDGSVPPDKFAYIVVQQYVAANVIDPGTTNLAQIRSFHPGSKVLAYQNLGGMIAGPHSNGRPTSLVTQEDADAHEAAAPGDSWNCHKISDNSVVTSADFAYMRIANLSRPSWQAAASQHFPSIKADGYDGVFLDDTNLYPGHGFNSAVPGPADPNAAKEFLTDASYRDAVVATLAALYPAARGNGLLMVPNIGMNPWTPAHYAGYSAMLSQQIIDGANREFWMGFNTGTLFTDDTWTATVQVLRDAAAAGVFSLLNTYIQATREDARAIVYAAASYYLFWNGVTADSVWYNNGLPLSEYHNYVNLGLPTEPAYQTNGGAGPGWIRHYTLGCALVNPSSTVSDTFGLQGSFVDPTGQLVTSVTLAPASAMLLTGTGVANPRTDLGDGRAPVLVRPGRGPAWTRFIDLPGTADGAGAPPPLPGLVQYKQGSSAAGSLTITLDRPTTAGNGLIVFAAASGTTANPTSISAVTLGGSAGNFAQAAAAGGPSDAAIMACWLDLDCAGGQTSVVITAAGGTGTIAMMATVYERADLVTVSAFDRSSPGVSAGSTSWTSGTTPATAQAAEVWAGAVFTTASGAGTITGPTAPWANLTQITQAQGSFTDQWMSGWQAVTSTGTAAYAGTVAPSSQSVALAVTLKAAGTGLAVPQRPTAMRRIAVPAAGTRATFT